jgi:hypothetical protein
MTGKIKEILTSRKGAAIIVILVIYMIVFPFLLIGLQDVVNIYYYSKALRIGIETSVKAACSSMQFDEDKLAEGIVEVKNAVQVQTYFNNFFKQSFLENPTLDISSNPKLEYIGSYVKVYTLTPPPPTNIPSAGDIPATITTKLIQARVTKPAVYAIARIDYKTFLFDRTVPIIAVSTAKYNISGIN